LKIDGKVSKIIFKSNKSNYAIIIASNPKESFAVSGLFPILYDGINIEMFGTWKTHKKHGKQFSMDSYHALDPVTDYELVDFLTSSIINMPRDFAFDVIRFGGLKYLTNYADVAFYAEKISRNMRLDMLTIQQTLNNAKHAMHEFGKRKSMFEMLTAMGFQQEIASKVSFSELLFDLNSVKLNPYQLIYPFDLTWDTVDKVALKNNIEKDSDVRIQEAIYYLIEKAANEHGHVYLPLDALQKMTHEFLRLRVAIRHHIENLETAGRLFFDSVNKTAYTKENYLAEYSVADNIYRLHTATPIVEVPLSPVDFTDFPYNQDQKEGISLALESNVSIVLGPAGTGKTTILKKTMSILKKRGYHFQLCAPTGRAAKIMKEITGFDAKTIQMVLKYSKNSKHPHHTSANQLLQNCYVVDEFSMVDIKLMAAFLEAIPTGSKLIILGDSHQLPSVGPGKVLEDLVSFGRIPMKELNEVYRNTSKILELATKVRRGEPVGNLAALKYSGDFVFREIKKVEEIKETIRRLVTEFHNHPTMDVFKDLQVVSPINNGILGVKELNLMIQDIVNPSTKNDLVFGDRIFRIGDKVLQNTNNDEKKVVNGDIGLIVKFDKRERFVTVDFDGRFVTYLDEEIFELDLAYALTVHKLQGGECKYMIFPFHTSFGVKMLYRKLLYTAWTRPKIKIWCLGEQAAIDQAIRCVDSDKRLTSLIDRLKESALQYLFLTKKAL
jgi:exodeoxyribonuclease V alpha subunit